MGKYSKSKDLPKNWLYGTEADASEYSKKMYLDIENTSLHAIEKQFLHAGMQFFGTVTVVKGGHGVRKAIKHKLVQINDEYNNLKLTEEHVRKILERLQDKGFIEKLREDVVVIPGKKYPRTQYTFRHVGKFIERNALMNTTTFDQLS